MKSLYDVDPRVCGLEMDSARVDYEFVMNRSIFDSNLITKTNFSFFKDLGKIVLFFFLL